MTYCKSLNLTPFQIHVLLGLSDCDGDGMVDYIPFAKKVVDYIDQEYRFETMVKKSQFVKVLRNEGKLKLEHPLVEDLDDVEMFRTFKKYDRNMNGTLCFNEYTHCLAEAPDIPLTKQEIITIALSADLNGDGNINFEEFMKHYHDTLNMIHFHTHLNKEYQATIQKELRLGT